MLPEEWNITFPLTILTGLATLYFLISFIRDPLRKIPGPLLARASGVWLIFLDNSGTRTQTLHNLHKRYGPVVRIGPGQVAFSTKQAMRDIYGPNTNYAKAPAYGAFGRKSLFTMRVKEEHRERQKRIAHIFGPASVAQIEPLITEQAAKLVRCVESRLDQPMDMMLWFRMLALDVTSDIFFGKNFGCLEQGVAPQILHDLDEVFPTYLLEWQFPLLHKLLMRIPYDRLYHALTVGHRFYDYGGQAFEDYVKRYGREGSRRDLLQKMIAERKEPDGPKPLSDKEIIVEITNLIFAGTDTTGNTFSYMFFELARHPEWQKMLRKELDKANFTGVPAHSDVSQLPVLDALIHETLRVWPASPASLPRVVPGGGGVIDGVKVPANTIVSIQSYTIQRDPVYFPRPNEFLPERWLNSELRTDLVAMRDMIFVWGKGQRVCMGKPIAMMELKVVTAALMKRFVVNLESEATIGGMEMRDHFVLMARDGKCILKFRERSII